MPSLPRSSTHPRCTIIGRNVTTFAATQLATSTDYRLQVQLLLTARARTSYINPNLPLQQTSVSISLPSSTKANITQHSTTYSFL
ncbi:hypothetical protein E4U38_008310 [Claviceps purpurea]|nr:hypothetical protein E4U38_008310 [Claviceps purpurea]KAG6308510.1 hypothetical protein E4U45_000731 [Claviceps purpurea]